MAFAGFQNGPVDPGYRTTDTLAEAIGIDSPSAYVLTASVTQVSNAVAGGGVRLPTAMAGYQFRVVNVSAVTINFYPPSGLAWSTLGTDVPLPIPSQTQSTGLQFIDDTCIAG